MRTIVSWCFSIVLLLGVGSQSASADVWTSQFVITGLEQDLPQTLYVFGSSTPNSGCSVNNAGYWLMASNGTSYPDYASVAPLIVAAYLAGKPVQLRLVGCTGWGVPIIAGLKTY